MARLLIVLTLMAGWTLSAQAPRGFFNWWDSPIAKDLNLSDDQTKQIRAVVRDYRTKLIDARASLEKAEAEMEDSFNDESLSQARAGDAIERLVAARSEMTRTVSQMSLRLRGVLTHEQWTELQRRRPGPPAAEMMRREMMRRPRGPEVRREERKQPPPPQQQQ
jgi:Spy/CpxP family protein refolding chaperone